MPRGSKAPPGKGSNKSNKSSGGLSKRSTGMSYADTHNEVDAFMDERDTKRKGTIHGKGKGKGGKKPAGLQIFGGDDDEDSDGKQGDNSDDDVVPVHDLADSDEDEEDEDEEDDGDDGEYDSDKETAAEAEKRMMKDVEKVSKAWGKKKANYYSADTQDFEIDDDMDDAEEEEREAKRLLKKQAAEFDEDDFGLDIGGTGDDVSGGKKKKATKIGSEGKVDKKSGKKQAPRATDEELLAAMNADLSAIDTENGYTGSIEKVEKNLKKLTQDDKINLVIQDAPELLGLLDEFQEKMTELRKHIKPLIDKVREKQLQTDKGISFLELKFQLLLSYCIHISFYLLLKAEGRSIKDHPVIDQIVHIRTILEKIKPIDKQLKYQIEKLLKTASMSTASAQSASSSADDLLSFKPNPKNMASAQDDAGDEDEDDGGVFKPSRMASTMFEEDERQSVKDKKKREKEKARASKNAVVKELRQELSERPEEDGIYGMAMPKVDNDDMERTRFEEDNWMRLMDTKADKKKRKEQQRLGSFDDFDDFGDLTALTRDRPDEATSGNGDMQSMLRKAAMDAAMNGSSGKKRKFGGGGFDGVDDNDGDFAGDADFAASKQYYADLQATTAARKKQRQELYPKKQVFMGKDTDFVDEDGVRRAAGKKIMKNRGLTRLRSKETKHSRTAYREKARKADIKQRSRVQTFKGSKEDYGGESTGVKKGLIKSVKLKS